MTLIRHIVGARVPPTGQTPDQILARQPAVARADPPLPGLAMMAKHATIAAIKTTAAWLQGKPILRTAEEAVRVETICRTSGPNGEPCPHFRITDNRCSQCGCQGGNDLIDMWKLTEKHCPLTPPKW